jgi:hypothetical protein
MVHPKLLSFRKPFQTDPPMCDASQLSENPSETDFPSHDRCTVPADLSSIHSTPYGGLSKSCAVASYLFLTYSRLQKQDDARPVNHSF